MADETDDPDIVAARLEAALERIAQLAAAKVQATRDAEPMSAEAFDIDPTGEITERLDSLIGRVRDALATRAG